MNVLGYSLNDTIRCSFPSVHTRAEGVIYFYHKPITYWEGNCSAALRRTIYRPAERGIPRFHSTQSICTVMPRIQRISRIIRSWKELSMINSFREIRVPVLPG